MNPASKSWPASVPRRVLFEAVQSGARTAQIGRAAVIFQKNPSVFRKSTCAPEALSVYFAKNTSDYFEINPQSRSDGLRVFCKQDLLSIENQPVLQRPSQQFLRKPPQIFLKSTFKPPLIISLFKKIAKTLKLHSKSQKNCKLENQVDLKSSRVELWSASII